MTTAEGDIRSALLSAFLSVIVVCAIGLIVLRTSIIFVNGIVFLISLV